MDDGDDRKLTPTEARDLQKGAPVVWVILRVWPGNALVARPHTVARDGGRFLQGRLVAGALEELRALLPAGLSRCEAWPQVTPPEWVEWWS